MSSRLKRWTSARSSREHSQPLLDSEGAATASWLQQQQQAQSHAHQAQQQHHQHVAAGHNLQAAQLDLLAGRARAEDVSEEEARALEESALEWAIQQSQQEGNSIRNGAALPAVPVSYEGRSSSLPAQPGGAWQQGTGPDSTAAGKPKRLSSLRKRLSFNSRGSGGSLQPPTAQEEAQRGSPAPAHLAGGFQPGRGGFANGQPGRTWFQDPRAVQAAMAESEASAIARAGVHERRLREAQAEEDAFVALAMEESVVQAQYDNILRDAKLLRRDLEHVLQRCLDHQADVTRQRDELQGLMGDFSHAASPGKGRAHPMEFEGQWLQSQQEADMAVTRVAAVQQCIEELVALEHYIRSTMPGTEEAKSLTEEIIRQLLARLNMLGLTLGDQQPQVQRDFWAGQLASKFRQHEHLPQAEPSLVQPAQPERPEPGGSPSTPPITELPGTSADGPQHSPLPEPLEAADSQLPPPTPTPTPAGSAAPSDLSRSLLDASVQELAAAVAQMAPSTGSSRASSPPAGSRSPEAPAQQQHIHLEEADARPDLRPAGLPTSSVMLTNEDLDAIFQCSDDEADSAGSGGSVAGSVSSSVAMSRSRAQSRQLLEKASSKLNSLLRSTHERGPAVQRRAGSDAVRRAPQVVHLHQELRGMLGDDRMCKELTDAAAARDGTLSGLAAWQPRSAGEEQARVRALNQDPEEMQVILDDAERHKGMLERLAGEVRGLRARSMDELAAFVADANTRLMALRADEAAVLAQLDTWPKRRFDMMREAVVLFKELGYLQAKARKWMLQAGSCSEECDRLEEFLDTARARVEVLQARQEGCERRFGSEQLPWDRAAFRRARHATLNLALIYMSRILFEVANLERGTVLQTEACLAALADAVRVAYKVHQFAGGFDGDCLELFSKVKRLAQYYSRALDPTWLKDSSKLQAAGAQQPWGVVS